MIHKAVFHNVRAAMFAGMPKSRTSKAIRTAAALSCVLTAACSSGSGSGPTTVTGTGGSTTSTGGGTSGSTGGSTGGTGSASVDTGFAGTVAAPAPATFGTAPAQLASSGGPTFDGNSGSFPANVTFPLLLSSLQRSSTGLSVVSGNQGATATVVSTSAHSSTLQLTIPSLGVLNAPITMQVDLVSHTGSYTDGLSYAVMGSWQQGQATTLQNVAPFCIRL